jgi:diaminopimelate epimerase
LIPFAKAHACGNDFLIITEDAATGHNWPELARRLCARNTGVGADGIEFFSWTGSKSGRIHLHNADGSVAEISGNGTRCVAAWMSSMIGAHNGDELRIETDAGMRVCRINEVHSQGGYSVDITTGMGIPTATRKTVTLANGRSIEGIAVATGNPHFVVIVDKPDFSVAGESWQSIGAAIGAHPDFPRQTNVEFVRILKPCEIELRIFERGVGPTTSSGTGTSASATAAIAFHDCSSPLTVIAAGGPQSVIWRGFGSELELTGPATLIARGEAWYA